MAALTTIETRLISKGWPLGNQYDLGERVKYLTTAGVLASGTVQGCAITSGTLAGNAISSGTLAGVVVNSMTVNTPTSTIDPENVTTAYQIQGGHNVYRASGGSVVRISSSLASGAMVTITNISTIASGVIALSTAGTLGLSMGSFSATAVSSANYLTLAGSQSVTLLLASGDLWHAITGTGSLATFSTVLTAS